MVDDGSSDNTKEVVAKYPSVKYIYQKHVGNKTPARAMNLGIRVSRGNYIICLGADDILEPTYVEECLKEIESDRRIGFVWTATQAFGSSNTINFPRRFWQHKYSFFLNPGGQLGAILVRRETYRDVGLYDDTLHGLEDWDFVIRARLKGWRGKAIFRVLHHARIHKDNDKVKPQNTEGQLYKKYPFMRIYAFVAWRFASLVSFLRSPKLSIIRLWNNKLSKYFGCGKITESPIKVQHAWVNEKRILRRVKGKSVLDCGCGIGRWAYLLRNKKLHIVGFDIHKPYLMKAKKYEEVVLATASAIPFKEKTFDTSLAVEIIEHLQKFEGIKFLNELKRVSKHVILTTPKYFEPLYFGINHPETHKSHWTREEILDILNYQVDNQHHAQKAYQTNLYKDGHFNAIRKL